ncbi:MAG: FAD binding domain-containing protein [Myxococcota bacterium]|nr:FAD binding domain-containing protein [Myxococcota bacterium]
MELPAFQYHRPGTAEEVVSLLSKHSGNVDIVAGGTDLLPNYKNRLNNKEHVISLASVEGLQDLEPTRLGALTRLVEIERCESIHAVLPALTETATLISSPPLREHGTVGGNLMLDTRCFFFNQSPVWRESKHFCLKAEGQTCLVVPSSNDHCYATYSGELAAPLLAFGASLDLLGPDGPRQVPMVDFFEDEGIKRFKDHREGEFLVGVSIPEEAQQLKSGYEKLRIRDSIDFPSLGVCVAFRLDENRRVEDLRLSTTALRSCPELLDEVTLPFVGETASAELAESIGAAAQKASVAYRNVPLDPKYRRKMVSVFVRRILRRLDPAWEA